MLTCLPTAIGCLYTPHYYLFLLFAHICCITCRDFCIFLLSMNKRNIQRNKICNCTCDNSIGWLCRNQDSADLNTVDDYCNWFGSVFVLVRNIAVYFYHHLKIQAGYWNGKCCEWKLFIRFVFEILPNELDICLSYVWDIHRLDILALFCKARLT